MKQKLFTLFLALVASVSAIYAQSGSCGDNLTWRLSNVTLTISGTGAMADYSYDSSAPWYNYRSFIKSVIINDGVKSIGKLAFEDCSSLTSVTIPESVTSIAGEAFRGCSSLTSVTIPNSVTSIGNSAFYGCSKLTSPVYNAHCFAYMPTSYSGAYTIPEGIKQIAGGAFEYCSSLTSITIPNSVTSIGIWAFWGCSSLTSVTIGESVKSIGDGAFQDCSKLISVTINSDAIVNKAYTYTSYSNISNIFGSQVTKYIIGDNVKGIGDYAFSGCKSLTSVIIGNSVTSIGDYAFSDCSSLTSVTIGNSVTSIGYYAFSDCSSLTSVTIGNSVTSIGYYAFSYCSSLTSIIIPNSVTSIGGSAFSDCSSLTSIIIPNSVTSIGGSAFSHCSSLTSVTIPNSVTSIGYYAFSDCSSLTSVTIGNSVTSIGEYTFRGCSSLTSVTIPNSVKTIGTSAFEGCARLGKISLGTGLEEIAANAFAGCSRLYDIYTYATYPPFAEESSFANYNVYVYVPCEYQRDYTLDIVWGKFKFIECIDSEDATTDGNVTVVPGFNDVTITWPTAENADTYSLVINKDNQPFCTLTFNQEGQLLNIAFAPSRDGNNRPAQYAEQAVNGYRFTVTGLTEATQYAYNITTKDAANKTIATYSGEFTTMGGSTSAVEDILQNTTNVQKLLRNGQLLIIRDGVEYTVMGQEL